MGINYINFSPLCITNFRYCSSKIFCCGYCFLKNVEIKLLLGLHGLKMAIAN